MVPAVANIRIDIPGLSIAGLRHVTGADADRRQRILAVHGWLDNAASFSPLAPLLDHVDLVAVDLPGHGHSGHLPPCAHYHFVDIPGYLFQVAEQLGWSDFHWIGHSLGGALAPFAAVSQPHRLRSITLLEATGPLTEIPSKFPARLRKSGREALASTEFRSRLLPSINHAVDARLRATKMTEAAARLIVERQLLPVEGGFHWRFDHRHRMTSPAYLTEPQVHAVLSNVDCPTLIVSAEQGYLTRRADTAERLACLSGVEHYQVPGHHHMHMDDPAPTAAVVNKFLAQQHSS